MGKAPIVKKEGAPDWIVTFTDLTSLLTTFFVLLLTFSTMEPQEDAKLQGAEAGSPSPLTEKISALQEWMAPPHKVNDTTRGEIVPDDQPLMNPLGGEGEVNIGELDAGGRVSFGRGFGFKEGLVRPESPLGGRIRELARHLQADGLAVTVEGHTDNEEIRLNGFDSALELSRRRALVVARLFLEEGWPRDRVSIRAFGSSRPRPGNNNRNPDEQAENRRIELFFRKAE